MKQKKTEDKVAKPSTEELACDDGDCMGDEDFFVYDDFVSFVIKTLDELKILFLEKNGQYGKGNDPLANFRIGAALNMACLQKPCEALDYRAMFEEALAYERKHIVHVMGGGVNGVKVMESLKDIAVYSIIEMYMAKRFQEAANKR